MPLARMAAALALILGACVAKNPDSTGTDTDTDPTTAADGSSTSDTGDTADPPWPDAGMLACDEPPCTFLFAVQTLDDRIEVFAPDSATPYRGAIEIDLKPNMAGDHGNGLLDEPYESALAGGFLHVATGHYPTRESGSLLAFPLAWLAGQADGEVPTAAYFDGSSFTPPVVHRSLDSLEPIFVERIGDRLLVSAFANDLTVPEDMWTTPGEILVLDVNDPDAAPGRAQLDDIMGDACPGAGEAAMLTGGHLAIACDGNEAVAVLDASGVAGKSLADGAKTLSPLQFCDLPPTSNVRVRHLTSIGDAIVVAESPVGAQMAAARLWMLSADCSILAFGDVDGGGFGTLAQVVTVPGPKPLFLVAGSLGRRGVWVVGHQGATLTACDTLQALDSMYTGDDDQPLEPFALAVNGDGTRLAVGAGPFSASATLPGYGKVLWAELSSSGPCGLEASTVVDLTDGLQGHAPATDPENPRTWRRGPNVLVMHEVSTTSRRGRR